MKNKKTFATILMLIIFLPLFVSAQYGNPSDGILGGTEKGILNTAVNILNYQIPVSGGVWWSYDYKEAAGAGTAKGLAKAVTVQGDTPRVALWLLAAVFTLIFTVIWVASSFVPLFKNDEHKGPRKWFCIAITLLTMFTTPVALMIINLVGMFTTLAYIAFLVLGVYTIWTLTRSGWAGNATENAASTKSLADARTVSAEAARQNEKTAEYRKKTKEAARTGVKDQKRAIQQLRKDLDDILKRFVGVRHSGGISRSDESRIVQDLGKISTDLGKILTFKTNNDRILSTMNATDYKETAGRTGLAKLSSPDNKAIIKRDLDTQTNDLGHTISNISALIQVAPAGITTAKIDRLINFTTVAVNIATRMERDLVLEEQMIEKI
ncbi:MAG: hypothetical protein ACP5N2_04205 [Candidatus Nanoarchaeia archaeon]